MKMNDMFFQNVTENHYVIYVNSRKIFENAKNIIDFALNIKREILEFHDCNVKLFLFTMKYDDKFMTIDYLDESLMKKIYHIKNKDESTICYNKNNIDLK